MQYCTQDAIAIFDQLHSSVNGLSEEEAQVRLTANGKNKLKEGKKTSLIQRFFKQMADPMILILLAAAVVSVVAAIYEGESFADVFIILFVVLLNAILGVIQENKAEKAIEALMEISAATSKVLRNGVVCVIKSEDLVVGDIILIEAGDAVPADARIIECASLKAEEAALTGESVPVDKNSDTICVKGKLDEIPLGVRNNMIYAGSSIVYGRGRAIVTAIGMDTEMGKIATAISTAAEGCTPLQIKLAQLSKVLTILVLVICTLMFVFSLWRAEAIDGRIIVNTFMLAVSLAVAAIPEGLVAVVTVVLSLGVTKMSKNNAIIRRLTAVETLGCTQVICSDKTGTLTQNKMTVMESYSFNETVDDLARIFALCNDASKDSENKTIGEPTEAALIDFADTIGINKKELDTMFPRIAEAPFDSSRKMMSTLHRFENKILQCTKGAPDELLKVCTSYLYQGKSVPLDDAACAKIIAANAAFAQQSLRVLGAAVKEYSTLPNDLSAENLEQKMTFVGLVGMIDPIRPEVSAAISLCKTAGIHVVMITGDHPNTAAAIGMQLGIITDSEQVLTGTQLNAISDDELVQTIKKYAVFARVQPEHKVRIINAWQAKGAVTAMTGDGINDAPAIKNADIGIGMGITGTDVTKNVADIVLADDNFATIVAAVEEGRRIYDNICKTIQFLLGSNLSEVISIFTATILGFTILQPAHILWINLITDCLPALALGMEKGESDLMQRKPRGVNENIFADNLGFSIIYQGLLISTLTLFSYFIGCFIESGSWAVTNSNDGTTMAFLTLSLTEIFHSFNLRSRHGSCILLRNHNFYLYGAMFVSLVLTIFVIYIPGINSLFGFAHISLMEFIIACSLAILIIPLVETVKFFERWRSKRINRNNRV